MEDNLFCITTFDGKQLLMEDDLRWKTIFFLAQFFFLTANFLWAQNIYQTQNFLDQNFFWDQHFLVPDFFNPKIFF